MTAKILDCVLCGSCVVDILVRPVPLDQPIGGGRLLISDPIEITTGGIVSNSGITLSKLGMKVAAFSLVGDDQWANMIRQKYEEHGIETSHLLTSAEDATSTTAVLIDEAGERSFAHCVGAPRLMDKRLFLENLDVFAKSRSALIGYYSLMPKLESDLEEVLRAIVETGCKTALDAAGDGGTMQPLDRLLPYLNAYVPSLNEAMHQTGLSDPEKIIEKYRKCGAPGLLGVKLGSQGALLSPADGSMIRIEQVPAPGPVIDTTGAGDCFYAGLLCGILRGLTPEQTGRLAAAAGACCVTGLGATSGIRDYTATAQLAGVEA